ncbi:unnamed protein product [Clonostachys solani]|uniref:DUF7587 domain-containing protein n=1 Tax=Clonostachys solani TaxID=160281 RepID=A0A9P0EEU4_9HYPO|nr:unnamed protein product [Clonostachys solani]
MLELIIIIDLSDSPPTSHIGFRFFDHESRARLHPEGDIRCGNWQEFDVGQDPTTEGAKNHIRGFNHKPTDYYISLTTSPLHQKIMVIDLRVLQKLGIPFGSTTDDLGFSGTGVIKTKYAAKHHVMVAGWIPPHSIAGYLPVTNFKDLLEATQIDTSRESSRSIQSVSLAIFKC